MTGVTVINKKRLYRSAEYVVTSGRVILKPPGRFAHSQRQNRSAAQKEIEQTLHPDVLSRIADPGGPKVRRAGQDFQD
jgi:hypothetical protein